MVETETEIVIEDGVPIPETSYSNKYRLALEIMTVGQSFVLYGKAQRNITHSAAGSMKEMAKKRGQPIKKFTIRKQPDNFYRVWRIE